jgi:hypothetical protein
MVAAARADGPELDHLIGLGHQPRHRPERLAPEVHVETRRDYLVSRIGQSPADLDNSLVEKLHFFDGHNVGSLLYLP